MFTIYVGNVFIRRTCVVWCALAVQLVICYEERDGYLKCSFGQEQMEFIFIPMFKKEREVDNAIEDDQ